MQHKYDIYRPQPSMQDVYTQRSYYHSPEITFSPGATIGSLVGSTPPTGKDTRAHSDTGTGSALLSENFKLAHGHEAATNTLKRSTTTPAIHYSQLKASEQTSFASGGILAAVVAQLQHVASRVHFAPKKYSADKGWYVDYHNRTIALAKYSGPVLVGLCVAVILLFASLNPGGLLEQHGKGKFTHISLPGQLISAHPTNVSSNPTSSGTPAHSSSNATSAAQRTLASPIAPVTTTAAPAIVGGYGGGPQPGSSVINPVTTPIQDVIPPVVDPTPQPTDPVTTPTSPVVTPVTDVVTPLITTATDTVNGVGSQLGL